MSTVTDKDFATYTENFKAADDTVSARAKPAKATPAKATIHPTRTFVDVAKDLARLEKKQAKQRLELAATDTEIAALQKTLKDLTDAIGKRK